MTSVRNNHGLRFALMSLVACGFVSALGAEGRPPIRVALMDFAVDDNSYRSAQAAASFTSVLQVEVASESGLVWVERTQLELAKKELRLSEMDLLSGTSDIRRGKWVKADWLVTGRFSLDDQSRRILYLEITDLYHADVLASGTVPFSGMAMTPMRFESDQVKIAAAALRRLFDQARDCAAQASGQVVIAPLFFVDLRDFGLREDFEPLKYAFQNSLDQLANTNARFRMVRFPKAYRAMDEAEMLLDGLVTWDSQSWESPADVYVWGGYSVKGSFTVSLTNGIRYEHHRTRQQLSCYVWDGVSAPLPVELERVVPRVEQLSVKEAGPFWERLAKAIQERASTQGKRAATGDVRRQIADTMVKTFIGVHGQYGQSALNDTSRFLDNIRLIETACFLDPDNQEAQVLRISSRWGVWMDYEPAVKNPFLSKWRRSNAWGKYVERFGLGPVTGPAQLPTGIPGAYVGSLAEVLAMVPEGWGLEQAQRKGFPRDMPADRIAEWRAQLAAELAVRKSQVEAQARSRANANAITNRLAVTPAAPARPAANQATTNAMAGNVGASGYRPAVTNQSTQARLAGRPSLPYPAPAGTNRQTAPPAKAPALGSVTATQRTPHASLRQPAVAGQPYLRKVGDSTNLFELRPPSLWPVEITPALTKISFPAHFETKTILRVVPWRDQLVMLVVDERAAPTSDPNPDIVAELSGKAGRLWTVQPGQTNPRLLEGQGMPEHVFAFLIEQDRLWVAGKVCGYLDLKDRSFHICQVGAGSDSPTDQALAASGGRLYTAQQFGIASFDPVASEWKALPGLGGRPVAGFGVQSLLTANERWLCYAAGWAACYNLGKGSWTIVTNLSMIRCLSAETNGFWMGGGSGLHFYEPETGSLQSWGPPMQFQGLWNVWRPPNLKALAEEPGEVAGGRMVNSVKIIRKQTQDSAARYPRALREPLRLDSHIPGGVASVVREGEKLWLGIADRLVLLDLPSRSLVACCRCGGIPVTSIGVSDECVWLGLAFGEQLLVRVPKRDFYAVPRSRWTPLTITADERKRLIAGMSVRDQAIYAFYGGDAKRVVKLVGNVNPAEATLEQMLLLAVTCDADDVDDPKLSRAWCEQIIGRYPDSPWATFARKAIEESQQNHSYRQHEQRLLEKFDRNRDGVLDAAEKRAMERDPGFKREQKALQDDLLAPQIQAIIRRYDRDGDGKLGRRELEHVKAQVATFLDIGPENLPSNKLWLAPLFTKDFPSIDVLLRRYDRNKDGALDANELKAFAQDLRK